MPDPHIEERLKKVFFKVFQIEEVQETSSPDNLKGWDSLGHLLLVSAIEEEFQIALTTEEIYQMVNFRSIKSLLEERLAINTD